MNTIQNKGTFYDIDTKHLTKDQKATMSKLIPLTEEIRSLELGSYRSRQSLHDIQSQIFDINSRIKDNLKNAWLSLNTYYRYLISKKNQEADKRLQRALASVNIQKPTSTKIKNYILSLIWK